MRRRASSPVTAAAATAVALALAACASHKDSAPHDAGHDAVGVVSLDADLAPAGHYDVLTQHNDVARTGQNLSETVLTTSNVSASTFGHLLSLPVQGLVYAQPLVVTSTEIHGEKHDVLVVATMHNMVYAFDANSGDQLWSTGTPLGTPVPACEIGYTCTPNEGGCTPCGHNGTVNTVDEVGILSTPVIDRDNGYIYLSRADYADAQMSMKVHVLSLATGKDEPGSPVTISASTPGAGGSTITFDATHESQRPGLLLLNGTVYLAFASYQDWFPFYGWVLGYTYANGSLTQTQAWISTPGGQGGGFWNSGQGLLSDGASIYGVTSNAAAGSSSPLSNPPIYGEAFLKLSPALDVQDWFVPIGYADLNNEDGDLGSGGPLLVPGTSPPLMVGGGKSGILYTVDTSNMGKLGTSSDQNLDEFTAVTNGGVYTNSIYGAPVVWTGGGAARLYLWGTGDVLKQFTFANGLFGHTPTARGSVQNVSVELEDPAGILSVSSNGSKAGTGIVWGVKPTNNPDHTTQPGTFYAFDALTLATLWSTPVNDYAKFVPPTVANGKVYLATHSPSSNNATGPWSTSSVEVYGLLSDGGT